MLHGEGDGSQDLSATSQQGPAHVWGDHTLLTLVGQLWVV